MSGNWNAAGNWEPTAPVFSEDEIERALDWRQKIWPDPRLKRRDRCPHQVQCKDLQDCVQFMAWYFRHRETLEANNANVA